MYANTFILVLKVPPSFSWVKRVCVGGETDNKTKCFVFWCCITVQPCPRSWISKCCSWSIDMFNIMRQRKGKQEAGIKPYILLRKIHVLISWESNPGSLAWGTNTVIAVLRPYLVLWGERRKELAVAGNQIQDPWLKCQCSDHWTMHTRQPTTFTILYMYFC